MILSTTMTSTTIKNQMDISLLTEALAVVNQGNRI